MLGPLDAGFTKSYYNMLDIMYDHGNDSTKQLAIVMGRKEEVAVSPLATPTSPAAKDFQRHSSSASNNSSIYSPTGYLCVCCVYFTCSIQYDIINMLISVLLYR